MPPYEVDILPKGPLTEDETQALRRMMQEYGRSRWLFRQVRWWTAWIAGTGVAIFSLKDQLAAMFKGG